MILLYAPRQREGEDYQVALEARGFEVVRAASMQGLHEQVLQGGVDLVILDDPPWEQARGVVSALDAARELAPRIWVTSWPEAPAQSGKLGVDALLIDPDDVPALVDRVQRLLHPRTTSGGRAGTSQPFLAMGSQPALQRAARASVPPPILDPIPTPEPADDEAGWDQETGDWNPRKL